jgi:hypothetical protein
MEIEQALYTYLTGFLSCSVYPGYRPQSSTDPCVTYQRKTGGYTAMLSGAASFTRPIFDIAVYSADITNCISISETIREKLQGFSGTLSTRNIWFIALIDESDSYFSPVDSAETGLFTTTQTYQVMYEEN